MSAACEVEANEGLNRIRSKRKRRKNVRKAKAVVCKRVCGKLGAGLDAIGPSSALTASTEALARARKGEEKNQETVVRH